MAVKQVFNTSAELDYPTVLPTLDLDFANSKTLDPRITFTRASGGTYVGADGLIKYAGVNEARFDHDPETGESLGLLIEEGRTNSLLRSEEFDDAYWSKGAISIIPNQIIAPDGTLTADKIIGNSSTSIGNMARFFSFTSGTSVTYSIYAKKGEIDIFTYLQTNFAFGGTGGNRSVTFNLTNGTVQQDAQGDTGIFGQIQNVGNGWYRCIATITPTSTVDSNMQYVRFLSTGDGTSGIFIWGAQLEVGSFPTSYIPTQASTRTRGRDVAQIIGKNFNFFNPIEGTLGVSSLVAPQGILIVVDSDDVGVGINRIQFSQTGAVAYTEPGNLILGNTGAGPTPGLYEPIKVFASYKKDDIIVARNGSYALRPGRGGPPRDIVALRIGAYRGFANSNAPNVPISRITYYPKFLSVSQHQALTS